MFSKLLNGRAWTSSLLLIKNSGAPQCRTKSSNPLKPRKPTPWPMFCCHGASHVMAFDGLTVQVWADISTLVTVTIIIHGMPWMELFAWFSSALRQTWFNPATIWFMGKNQDINGNLRGGDNCFWYLKALAMLKVCVSTATVTMQSVCTHHSWGDICPICGQAQTLKSNSTLSVLMIL